jgi:hypothetical protein
MSMIHLPGVLAAAGDVQRFCLERRWQFCFIGGVAVQRWGEPRLTQDVDLTVLTGLGNEERFADAMIGAFGRGRDARCAAVRGTKHPACITLGVGGGSLVDHVLC